MNPFQTKPLSKSRLLWALEQSKSLTSASQILGVTYNTFKKYCVKYDLFEQYKNQEGRGIPKRRKKSKDLLKGFDLSEFPTRE